MSCIRSSCALDRFKGASAPERPSNIQAVAELESALEKMKREREEQNAKFFPAQHSKEQRPSNGDQPASWQ
jgi:hypothetical protein